MVDTTGRMLMMEMEEAAETKSGEIESLKLQMGELGAKSLQLFRAGAPDAELLIVTRQLEAIKVRLKELRRS